MIVDEIWCKVAALIVSNYSFSQRLSIEKYVQCMNYREWSTKFWLPVEAIKYQAKLSTWEMIQESDEGEFEKEFGEAEEKDDESVESDYSMDG